jgi:tetratricopeptide (TPR) repeat protein
VYEKKRASAPPPPRERKDVMRDIDSALAKREFAFAEQEAKRLAESDADDGEAQAIAAWAAAQAGDASEDTLRASIAKLDRAAAADRLCERTYYYRGMIAKRLGNVPNAMRDFARAVQLNPKHVDAQRELRVIEMRARKSGELKLGDVLSKLTGKK